MTSTIVGRKELQYIQVQMENEINKVKELSDINAQLQRDQELARTVNAETIKDLEEGLKENTRLLAAALTKIDSIQRDTGNVIDRIETELIDSRNMVIEREMDLHKAQIAVEEQAKAEISQKSTICELQSLKKTLEARCSLLGVVEPMLQVAQNRFDDNFTAEQTGFLQVQDFLAGALEAIGQGNADNARLVQAAEESKTVLAETEPIITSLASTMADFCVRLEASQMENQALNVTRRDLEKQAERLRETSVLYRQDSAREREQDAQDLKAARDNMEAAEVERAALGNDVAMIKNDLLQITTCLEEARNENKRLAGESTRLVEETRIAKEMNAAEKACLTEELKSRKKQIEDLRIDVRSHSEIAALERDNLVRDNIRLAEDYSAATVRNTIIKSDLESRLRDAARENEKISRTAESCAAALELEKTKAIHAAAEEMRVAMQSNSEHIDAINVERAAAAEISSEVLRAAKQDHSDQVSAMETAYEIAVAASQVELGLARVKADKHSITLADSIASLDAVREEYKKFKNEALLERREQDADIAKLVGKTETFAEWEANVTAQLSAAKEKASLCEANSRQLTLDVTLTQDQSKLNMDRAKDEADNRIQALQATNEKLRAELGNEKATVMRTAGDLRTSAQLALNAVSETKDVYAELSTVRAQLDAEREALAELGRLVADMNDAASTLASKNSIAIDAAAKRAESEKDAAVAEAIADGKTAAVTAITAAQCPRIAKELITSPVIGPTPSALVRNETARVNVVAAPEDSLVKEILYHSLPFVDKDSVTPTGPLIQPEVPGEGTNDCLQEARNLTKLSVHKSDSKITQCFAEVETTSVANDHTQSAHFLRTSTYIADENNAYNQQLKEPSASLGGRAMRSRKAPTPRAPPKVDVVETTPQLNIGSTKAVEGRNTIKLSMAPRKAKRTGFKRPRGVGASSASGPSEKATKGVSIAKPRVKKAKMAAKTLLAAAAAADDADDWDDDAK
jgi:hypothetical protein